jgi:hypothetical protein
VPDAADGSSIDITCEVSDDVTPPGELTVYLLYKPGGKAFDTQITMENEELGTPPVDTTTFTGTIPPSAVTNKGLSYRIMALDADENASSTARHNVTITGASVTLAANALPTHVPAATPSTFRMISVPIDSGLTSDTLFSVYGTAGINWLGWHFEKLATNSGYRSIDTDSITHNPGVAVWFGTDNPGVANTVAGTPLDTTQARAIRLYSGWNQIGCPFYFRRLFNAATIKVGTSDDIAAAVDINTASGVTPPYPIVSNFIYWFPGTSSDYSFASSDSTVPNQTVFNSSWIGAGYNPDGTPIEGTDWPATLDQWGGYWFYAYVDCYLFVDPTTPGPGATPNPMEPDDIAAPAQPQFNWSVRLLAESDNYIDANNFAGIVADASIRADKYDVLEAPVAPGSPVQLFYPHSDWGIMSGDYAQDMVELSDEMIWKMQAKATNGTPVLLRWDASVVPAEYRTVALIDTAANAMVDLRTVSSYAYTPSSDETRLFKLIISKALPEIYMPVVQSELLQNYPNPFNPETWIPFKLSKAADVTIRIYTVSGKLVKTLELGHRDAGAYITKGRVARWDGTNNAGERVASGVYMYHIKAGSFNSSKKMVVLK